MNNMDNYLDNYLALFHCIVCEDSTVLKSCSLFKLHANNAAKTGRPNTSETTKRTMYFTIKEFEYEDIVEKLNKSKYWGCGHLLELQLKRLQSKLLKDGIKTWVDYKDSMLRVKH